MPFEHYVGEESPEINKNNTGTWKPIGVVARMLVDRADAAGVDLTNDSAMTQIMWDEIADAEGLPCFQDIAHDVSRGYLK